MERLQQFELAATAVATKTVRSSSAALEETVTGLLRSMGIKHVVSDSQRVVLREFNHVAAPEAECGITDGEWGIAATGSVILPMTVDRHRSTSLVPSISVIILATDRILPDLPAAIAHIGETYMKAPDKPSSVILVTGPSRTADIELNLVMGVHGPRELVIVLTDAK